MIWNGLELPPAYYQDDAVYIINADYREVLPLISKVDLVLTDPPYGIGEAHGKNKSRGQLAQPKDYGVDIWDDKPIDQYLMNQVVFKGKHAIIFGGNYYCFAPSSCWIVWDKDNTGDFADCELAWTNFDTAVRKYLWRWNGMLQEPNHPKEFRYHPTQKPSGLFSQILRDYSEVTDLILDPFLGSGTTCYCAKKLGRKSIGIEISEKYCEIAANRCRQSVLDLKVEQPKDSNTTRLLL